MDLQSTMAAVMRTVKDRKHLSLTAFSEELGISRSTLQKYLSGTGNPSLVTLGYLANRMRVEPSFLISGAFSENQLDTLLKFLDMFQLLTMLNDSQRHQFAELLLYMIQAWDENESSRRAD